MTLFTKKKEPPELETLLRPHLRRLYRLAYRITRSRDDAEDLVQELVVKLLPRRAEIAALDNAGTWLSKVLYRMCVDHLRRCRRNPVGTASDQGGEEGGELDYERVEGHQPGPVAQLEQARFIEQVQQAVETLSEEHRVLILLHDVEGYTTSEIQAILELPSGTIKSRLHRARARLRETLERGTERAAGAWE